MKWSKLYILAFSLCAFGGCGLSTAPQVTGRLPTNPVDGLVTLNGTPVEGATVMLRSEALKLSAYGKTDAAGRFELTTYNAGDGAPEGEFAVIVKKVDYKVTEESQNQALPPKTEETWHLPRKYADPKTSGLTANVVAGENNFQFDLQGGK